MKPRIKLAEVPATGNGTLALFEQDGALSISCRGQELMHSRANASEIQLGELGVAHLARDQPTRVLVGGLGLGFTLRSVLDHTGPSTAVDVVELLAAVVDWNRSHLRQLNRDALFHPRVQVRVDDAARVINAAKPCRYDAILLDLDNGPVALVTASNSRLYTTTGLRRIHRALKPGGRAVFWSAGSDHDFTTRLQAAGFSVTAVPAKVHQRAQRTAYLLYLAERPA